MTSIEEHKKKIREHLEELDAAINIGIEKRPATIAFHCSACSLQFLELYLHAAKKIDIGKTLNHEWFKRPASGQKKELLIERQLGVDFPQKTEIYELLYQIEEERNSLMYGKPIEQQIKKVLEAFNNFKKIMNEALNNEGVNNEEVPF
jgi:hypothetical protein